jgi:hypothetical protein
MSFVQATEETLLELEREQTRFSAAQATTTSEAGLGAIASQADPRGTAWLAVTGTMRCSEGRASIPLREEMATIG